MWLATSHEWVSGDVTSFGIRSCIQRRQPSSPSGSQQAKMQEKFAFNLFPGFSPAKEIELNGLFPCATALCHQKRKKDVLQSTQEISCFWNGTREQKMSNATRRAGVSFVPVRGLSIFIYNRSPLRRHVRHALCLFGFRAIKSMYQYSPH